MPEKPKEQRMLPAGRFHLAESQRNNWVIDAEQGTTIDDFLNPSYWSNFSAKMRPFDLIEARLEDGTYWGLFLVLTCDRAWARVKLIIDVKATTADVAQSQAEGYRVDWLGPIKKACVVRVKDGAVMREGEPSKAAAYEWLKNFEITA